MDKRLFVALELPAALRPDLAGLVDADLAGARWVRPEKWHLTLSFLGNVSAEGEAALWETLATVRAQPFSLGLRGVGSFGPARSPRVLWAGVDGETEALGALRAAVQQAVRAAGVQPDSHGFAPHLTLARCGRDSRPEAVREWLKRHAAFRAGPFAVEDLTLFSSVGGVYGRELIVPL